MVNKKGSLTVEMAFLMPVFLLVLMGSIYLCFYVHNRAWLSAAAHESALLGCQELRRQDPDPETAARVRGKQLLSTRLFGAENLQMQVSQSQNKITVRFDADTIASYGGLAWHLSVEAEEKGIDPVGFIWKIKGFTNR